jgi:PPOX class probable F420-dependent enzyme
MASIDDVRGLVALDNGLAHLSTVRRDGSVHSTVVNAGIIDHPVTGAAVAAFVSRAGTLKLQHLRAQPAASLCWRAGWAWATVEGIVELVGPDDPHADLAPPTLLALLRTIFSAAGGGEHQDWADYDRVMAAERRVAVLLTPRRIYVNP